MSASATSIGAESSGNRGLLELPSEYAADWRRFRRGRPGAAGWPRIPRQCLGGGFSPPLPKATRRCPVAACRAVGGPTRCDGRAEPDLDRCRGGNACRAGVAEVSAHGSRSVTASRYAVYMVGPSPSARAKQAIAEATSPAPIRAPAWHPGPGSTSFATHRRGPPRSLPGLPGFKRTANGPAAHAWTSVSSPSQACTGAGNGGPASGLRDARTLRPGGGSAWQSARSTEAHWGLPACKEHEMAARPTDVDESI